MAWRSCRTDFQDGTIEADVALKITTPPGVRMPGFVGIAFRMRQDASHGEQAYFSNVRVTNTTPEPVKNGSDAAGTWQVKLAGNTGAATGTLELIRDGNKLSGTVCGDMGKDCL